jgi:hypothetical protein
LKAGGGLEFARARNQHDKELLLNKRKNLAMRKHRLTAQKKKARQKGIDPSANALWNVGPWEERRSRGWRNQRSGSESAEPAAPARRPRARS